MTVNELTEKVIAGIKPEWDDLHKIRYVYIEVGKVIARDTDFFFSVDNKLEESNLSVEEIKKIYESEDGREMAVICKSAAMILKKIYDRLGIESWLVKSNNNFQELIRDDEKLDTIYHWFLAVKDGDKIYFLTLNTDLPNIQMGLETEHFARPIQYIREIKGEKIQVYSGEEIKESVVPRDVLFQVDKDIGYIKHQYQYNQDGKKTREFSYQYDDAGLAMLRDSLRGEQLYFELEMQDTLLNREGLKFVGADGKKKTLLNYKYKDLTPEDWELWKRKFCKLIIDRIEELLGYELNVIPYVDSPDWNYDVWLMRLCVTLQQEIFNFYDPNGKEDHKDVYIDVTDFKFSKWSSSIKKKFNYKGKSYDYNNILVMIDRMNAMVQSIGPNMDIYGFFKMFRLLEYNFIPKEHIMENCVDEHGYLNNSYIANKFQKLFVKVFSCNQEITDFNKMGYSEQVVIIKKIIEYFFPEITKANSNNFIDYNEKYSPVANRIHIYPIKSKSTGEYSIVFNIIGESRYDDYYFLYDLKNNTFGVCDIFDISLDYEIISDRMKDRMTTEDVEWMGIKK